MKHIQPLNPQDFDENSSSNHEAAAHHAANLIRGQIHAMHEAQRPDPIIDRAAYERWYYTLTAEQQQAEWDRYYSENEQPKTQHVEAKHAVSQSFAQHHTTPQESVQIKGPEPLTPSQRKSNSIINPFRSLLTAAAIALFFSFAFYNQIVIGQVRSFISPASTISSPIILDPSLDVDIGLESRIIIPKINVDVPVVYDVDSLEESAIQQGLDDGVVDYNYPGTVDPGQIGNNVIVGHSSNNFLNSGKYKFAFVLLERLELGDTFILHHEGTRYIYTITNREIIEPTDFTAIAAPTDKPITTLITCTPPGTSWKRFIIQAEQISPSAETAEAVTTSAEQPDIDTPVPGNAPSLWSQLFN